tara:strand:- start:1052 stop:1372 length:321 start_codon:yes stop_codon:yes gene_type:complete
MSPVADHFAPRQDAAQARLGAFAPHAGADYAKGRDYDLRSQKENHVSALLPYLRICLLDEITVARAVLPHHSAQAGSLPVTARPASPSTGFTLTIFQRQSPCTSGW